MTADQQRRLDKTPIDYSDIPPLDEEIFPKGRALLNQIRAEQQRERQDEAE